MQVKRLEFATFCAVLFVVAAGESGALRTEQGHELFVDALHQAANTDGFSAHAVHALRVASDGTLVHVRHPVAPPARAPLRRLSGAFATRREVVRALWRLSMAAYGRPDPYSESVMQAVWDAGDSLFGTSVRDMAAERAAQQALLDNANAWIAQEGNKTVASGGMSIDAAPSDSIGVMAIEFKRPGFGTALVFRGTMSSGDSDNIKPWVYDWILTRLTQQMRYQWTNIARLKWTDAMEKTSKSFDTDSRSFLSLGLWFQIDRFQSKIKELASANGLDPEKAAMTGYWEFTKRIADVSLESFKASASDGEKFFLSGHSQGGTTAALTSMYFEKRYGFKYETISFSAPGTLCFSRRFGFTNGNLLDDVNPYIMHDQITDYVVALDVYGFQDYDPGNQCILGMTNIAASAQAKYCEATFGSSGPDIYAAGSFSTLLGLYKEDLMNKFKRCKYFTHFPAGGVSASIFNDTLLFEDGKTDGGCSVRTTPISQDDPEKLCPTGSTLDRVGDGCKGALSCEACGVSSSKYLGSECFWCNATRTCSSRVYSWYTPCKGGAYKQCLVASFSTRAVPATLQVLVFLGLFPVWLASG